MSHGSGAHWFTRENPGPVETYEMKSHRCLLSSTRWLCTRIIHTLYSVLRCFTVSTGCAVARLRVLIKAQVSGPNTYGARFLASKIQAHAERPSRDVWLTHSTITHELSRPDGRS